ncbi:hypothetical protein H4S07_004080 [Coemansia furcata]|uniref:Uncharacterized protein n=1 Tax=Coemansia furcata TaxID=417177 RepID=A0ACC1LBN5_9FUNG|nr:hypothetical protein H4S07_004080 [Coemansia furcata]
MWSNHGAVRQLLDGTPPLVYPSVTLSGDNFSLPRFNVTRTPWKAIKKLHATPEARNTVHRLSINRIPKRQGLFPRECHCGALETVAHLTGICRDFALLRDQFFPRWIALAHTLAPMIRDELQAAATEAAKNEAAEKHAAAVERAMATNAPPPTPDTQSLIINISLPRLPVVPPELDNWVALPLLQWGALADLKSTTAVHFLQLYQLAAAHFLHLLWVARNDLAYSDTRWTRQRFMVAFNLKLKSSAQAVFPPQSPIMRHAEMVDLTIEDPAPLIAHPPDPCSMHNHTPRNTISNVYTDLVHQGCVVIFPP